MAPDADTLRQRKQADTNSDAATQPAENHRTLKALGGNEVAIEGVIYDIKDFDHPGGESIKVFGGNDVTVQYKMIHSYHTSKHLEKMKRVGKVANYSTEYKFDTPFEREIKQEVFKIVRRGSEFGTPGWYFRCAFYVTFFFGLQYLWVTTKTSFLLAVIYGVSQAFIGLNVQHDANHGAVSRKPWINDFLGFAIDFVGNNKWIWLEQHWTHHAFTNHHERDPDNLSAEPMILFNDYPPGHPKRSLVNYFQAFYYIFVLAGYWVAIMFDWQILDLKHRGARDVGIKMESDYLVKCRKYAYFLRLLYVYTNIVTPIQNQGFSLVVIAHILVMGISFSLVLAILSTLSHNNEHCDRYPAYEARHGGDQVCWFKSQVETSSTYGGFISGWLTGGLNFQVEHHLFPRMNSAWYPYIAPTVRKICNKHGVKYAYYPWIWQNLISTIKYLHQSGTASNWSDGNKYSGKL